MATGKINVQAENIFPIIKKFLYSDHEIFLRELVSNASDALDKVRYLQMNDENYSNNKDYRIRLSVDKEQKVLTIEDTGIGMSREDLVNNLGTIARSGTKTFLESLKGDKNNIDMIGQFGMGFYSAYLVADKVKVTTKKEGECAYVWESEAKSSFDIAELEEDIDIERGTKIELFLKSDMDEYLTENKLKDIVVKHSQFISYPIELYVEKTKEVEVEDTVEPDTGDTVESEADDTVEPEAGDTVEPEAGDIVESEAGDTVESEADDTVEPEAGDTVEPEAGDTVEPEAGDIVEPEADDTVDDKSGGQVDDVDDKSGGQVDDVEEEEETNEVKKKTEKVLYYEWEKLNKEAPLWTKNKNDVTDDEYKSFYKNISNDWEDYLSVKHFSIEGNINVKGLLFIPKKKPFDLFQADKKKTNIKLYVKRVLITDEMKDLIPEWLSFICGAIDCEDLPLNVSREMLQQSSVMNVIKKNITKKCLELIEELMDKDEDYKTFYENFSKNIKLGIHEDEKNRQKLSKLLRYNTSKDDGLRSFDDYISELKEDEKDIYYITGENLESVKNSPFLEKLSKNNKEVIFMVDPLDEYIMQNLKDYEGKNFVSITKEGLNLGDEVDGKEYEDLCKKMKEVLGDQVENVKVSNRIVDSPSCLVTTDFGWSANMERIMSAQALGNSDMSSHMKSKKILEINSDHKIIKELNRRLKEDSNDKTIKDLSELLYDVSSLRSGFNINDSKKFANRLTRMIELGLSLEDDNDEDIEEVIELEQAEPSHEDDNDEDNNSNEEEMDQVD